MPNSKVLIIRGLSQNKLEMAFFFGGGISDWDYLYCLLHLSYFEICTSSLLELRLRSNVSALLWRAQFLSDKTVFVWRKHNLLLSFESRILMNSDYRAAWAVYREPIKEECIPTVQNYFGFIHYGDRIIWLIMTGNAIWWQSGLKTVTESDDFSTFGHLTRICRSVRILWQSDFSSMPYPYIPVFLFLYVLMFLCWGNGMSIY